MEGSREQISATDYWAVQETERGQWLAGSYGKLETTRNPSIYGVTIFPTILFVIVIPTMGVCLPNLVLQSTFARCSRIFWPIYFPEAFQRSSKKLILLYYGIALRSPWATLSVRPLRPIPHATNLCDGIQYPIEVFLILCYVLFYVTFYFILLLFFQIQQTYSQAAGEPTVSYTETISIIEAVAYDFKLVGTVDREDRVNTVTTNITNVGVNLVSK